MMEQPLDVAVVDDETSVGTLCELHFRKLIRDGDMKFHFFSSASQYLNYLQASVRHPGLEILLTDINMPEVSGFDLLREVKDHYPSIDVFMMSAYDDDSSIDRSLKLGAAGYFTKPVNYKELKELMAQDYGVPPQ